MKISDFRKNLEQAFEGLSYQSDVFLDANPVDPSTGQGRVKKWGSLYRAYESIRDYEKVSETENPEKCIGIIDRVISIAQTYFSELQNFSRQSTVYTNQQAAREIRRTEVVYERIIKNFREFKKEAADSELLKKLLKLTEYQLEYYKSVVSKILDPMTESGRILDKSNYSFWPEVEALYDAFMSQRELLPISIEIEETADTPLVCLATVNAIKRNNSTILSGDMGVSNTVEDVFYFLKDNIVEALDGQTELFLRGERKVVVYRIGNSGDALQSTNTQGIALGSLSIDTRRKMREEAQRLRREAREPKIKIDQKFWDSL